MNVHKYNEAFLNNEILYAAWKFKKNKFTKDKIKINEMRTLNTTVVIKAFWYEITYSY